MRFILTWVLLLAPSLCFGQIDVPDQSEPYKPIVATVDANIPDDAQVRGGWSVSNDVAFLPAPSGAAHLWAPPGTHTVSYRGVWVLTKEVQVDGEALPVLIDFGVVDLSADFRVADPDPEPDPEPDPDPTPGPIRSLQVTVVAESAQRTAQQAVLLYQLRQWCAARGVPFFASDPDATGPDGRRPAWLQSYLEACQAQDVPLPAIVALVERDDGSQSAVCRSLPDDVAIAISFLTEYLPDD